MFIAIEDTHEYQPKDAGWVICKGKRVLVVADWAFKIVNDRSPWRKEEGTVYQAAIS